MRKLLIGSLCLLLFMGNAAASVEPHVRTIAKPIGHIKASLRFNTFSSYLQYISIKAFKGLDSANVFYREEFQRAAENYTDPWLLLTGGTLTGALAGTDASFTGRIGVGTTTPVSELQLYGKNSSTTNGITLGRGSDDAAQITHIYTLGGGEGMVINNIDLSRALSSGVDMYFRNTGSNGSRTNMFIQGSNGNVGIGTTSPGSKLDVSGNANISGTLAAGATTFVGNGSPLTLKKSSAVTGSLSIDFQNSSGTEIAYVGFGSSGNNLFMIANTLSDIYIPYGNVGIGTSTPPDKLSVNGNISADGNITGKKLTVTQTPWSDYVFNADYKLRNLQSLEAYINKNKHLPEVPSAKEVERNGVSVGDTQALLLKKIEELTLYVIDMNKKLATQDEKINRLQKKLYTLRKKK
jgi:hypothetical protein